MHTKKLTSLLSGVIGGLLLLSGCSAAEAGVDKDNGALTIIDPSEEILGLDPAINGGAGSLASIANIYETLVKRDPATYELGPGLAESWDNPDDLTWIFHLRQGVKFQDGTDFNADAVLFTYDRAKNDPKAVRATLFDPIESIEKVDDMTVQIVTKEPTGTLLDNLARSNLGIVSPEAGKNGDLNSHPVGTGPFQYESWKQGDELKLTAFDDYWDGTPAVSELDYRSVPDANTAISLLETGEVDLVSNIPTEQRERVENMDGVTAKLVQGTGVMYLGMNTQTKPLDDVRLRKAISMAIDREAYIDHIDGVGKKSDSYIGDVTFGYTADHDNEGYAYDQDTAKKIIKDNGWDGLELDLLSANDGGSKDRVTYVQDALSKVGIKVNAQLLDKATYIDRKREKGTELTMNGWTPSGNNALTDTLHSSAIPLNNVAFFSDKKVDALLDEANGTLDDKKRAKLFQKADLAAMKQAPWVVLTHEKTISAMTDLAADSLIIQPSGTANVVVK